MRVHAFCSGNLTLKMCSTGKKRRSPTLNPRLFETTVFGGTTAKRHQISLGNLTTDKKHEISSGHLKNVTVGHKPQTLLQWVMGVHSISLILQHHLSTIFTSHRHHQPQTPRRNPPITQWHEFSSRQVIFSTINIDLLEDIVVTFATSHRLSSSLKAKAPLNTVARKEGQSYSQSTLRKRRREEKPLIKILGQPIEGKHSSKYIHLATNPNSRVNLLESQEHVQVTLRHPQLYVSTWCHACW
jgi:hypothetical protein